MKIKPKTVKLVAPGTIQARAEAEAKAYVETAQVRDNAIKRLEAHKESLRTLVEQHGDTEGKTTSLKSKSYYLSVQTRQPAPLVDWQLLKSKLKGNLYDQCCAMLPSEDLLMALVKKGKIDKKVFLSCIVQKPSFKVVMVQPLKKGKK